MKIPQTVREVIEKGPLAHLTTLNPNGSPQVTVVWVGIEGEEFVMGHLAMHQKVKNIRRDPRVALSLLGLQYDARDAAIRGDLRHCAGDRRWRSAVAAAPGPDLPRAGGGISAGRDAEYCGSCHQDHAGTLLRDWSVGSTSHWLTVSRWIRVFTRIISSSATTLIGAIPSPP
jgi:PPOX class probable F420-dependent enzyme